MTATVSQHRDVDRLQIALRSTISDAFRQLNIARSGILFVIDTQRRVIGAVTDGDIRRYLLDNPDVEAPIDRCMNMDFVRVDLSCPRERVLKLLDHRIRAVPVIDDDGRLRDVVTRRNFRLDQPGRVLVRARSPVRIAFGGGGTDVTRHFAEHGGAVMNAAVALHAHALMRRTDDGRVRIRSHDLDQEVQADSPYALVLDGTLDLIKAVIQLIEPTHGFELEVGMDVPPRSGLGGSAVVAAAVIGCFNQLREDRWDRHQIAEMAFQAERLMLEIPGGWQDQYATVFGGFNFIQFTDQHNTVMPLRLEPEIVLELEESLLLCYTELQHDSGEMHRQMQLSEGEKRRFAQESADLTLEMKRLLLRGRLEDYGRLLDISWALKRRSAPHVTTPGLDSIYETAMAAGALGGRLLGAGGGGHFLFYAPPFRRHAVRHALEKKGLRPSSFAFDGSGLKSWTTRDNGSIQ